MKTQNEMNRWTVCKECAGRGKKKQRIRKSVKIRYERALEEFKNSDQKGPLPVRPHSHLLPCPICSGSGLIASKDFRAPDHEKFPRVAIIGGGIGGVALAVACLHRGIPFTLYERDESFAARSQGYGLTLQQASKAIDGFGIFSLDKGVVSTRHLAHTPGGKVVGEWGMRKWMENNTRNDSKRSNVHIARQSLRSALLNQLAGTDYIKWGHQFISFNENKNGIELTFQVDGKTIDEQSDLLVGADGIRSVVRNLLIGEDSSPLRYLGCIVILGICPLSALENSSHHLLDSATVFQTANGNERIYVMPYDADSVMWQLSFPMSEEDAKALSEKGSKALKEEAILRTPWHAPIPEILIATDDSLISGYPVYDRDLLSADSLAQAGAITLMGDAAHPMSPFKGQGANQALLDALSLAREIYKKCSTGFNWRENGIREHLLKPFETEMLERSAIKVKDSAAAAEFLHSEIALYEGDEPRGKVLKRRES
ncbi:FAD-dependent oxidoreductase [Kaistella faecalis]|uniref:FAD-dependent oxidoreductase n=1 Tax=Kaistella faecalis TaxID=2852098 RepID=UPI001E2A5280|nr:NAD(P)/FAD-dependent oxidoreductase [Chryseobacterium faecale]UFK98421.1 FAD-dependent monooxygenase [Chryseobacterium faecale]